MDDETWMTAEEALSGGFATQIDEPDEQVQESAVAIARRFRMLGSLKHVPERFRAGQTEECNCDCEACDEGNCAQCTNSACGDANCLDCPMQRDVNDLQARLEGLDLALRI